MDAAISQRAAVVETVAAEVFVARAARRDAHAVTGPVVSAIHPALLAFSAATYAVMIATFSLGFNGPLDLKIAFGIDLVWLLAFLGVPYALARSGHVLGNRTGMSLGRFLNASFDTYSGPVSGWAAFVLVNTVPVCLTLAAIAMAIIARSV